MRWLIGAVIFGACAMPRVGSNKEPLRFDPPAPVEFTDAMAAAEADDEGRAQDALLSAEGAGGYTDTLGNRYNLNFESAGDQTLVETIESGRGGPLSPQPAFGPDEADPTGDVESRDEPTSTGAARERPIVPQDGRPYMVMQWPMPATGVTSLFGARTDPITNRSRFHYGVDLEGTYGQIIQSLAPGRVIFSGWNAGHGRMVIIEHPGGWRTSYSHLSITIASTHDYVVTGQVVGQMGNSGRSTGPHLHLEVTRWGTYYDPLDVLGRPVPIDWQEF